VDGRSTLALAGWRALGERYEEAVVLVVDGTDDASRATGRAILLDLGAHATLSRTA
jgi:hypothetical protein